MSFFGPRKKPWKAVLTDWKKKYPTGSSVEKSLFPGMLKKLFDKIANKMSSNTKSGFAACGLFPLCKEKLLKKVPSEEKSKEQQNLLNDSILSYLKLMRNPEKKERIKRRKLDVVPGRSVSEDNSFNVSLKSEEKKKQMEPTKKKCDGTTSKNPKSAALVNGNGFMKKLRAHRNVLKDIN